MSQELKKNDIFFLRRLSFYFANLFFIAFFVSAPVLAQSIDSELNQVVAQMALRSKKMSKYLDIFFGKKIAVAKTALCTKETVAAAKAPPLPLTLIDPCTNVGKGHGKYCITVQFSGGRLGNQLFEVATALSIAKDNHCTAVFPMMTKEDRWDEMDTWGFDAKKLFSPYLDDSNDAIFSHKRLGDARDESELNCFKKTYEESVFLKRENYSKKLGQKLPLNLQGMSMSSMVMNSWTRPKNWGLFKFISHKQFHHNEKYLQQVLGPSPAQREALFDKFEKFGLKMRGQNIVSIHIRKGDRSQLKWRLLYPSPREKYYRNAILRMEAEAAISVRPIDRYIVLSDDVDYARSVMTALLPSMVASGKMFFVDWRAHKQKDYEDIWLMSMTQHNIIGNSTFSFWGAYLNPDPNKIVIAPKKWLGPVPQFSGLKTGPNGITPPEWIIVN